MRAPVLSDIPRPAPDEIEPELHPALTDFLAGHDAATATIAEALTAGSRLHHAWLLTGPRGIGKATLAYHFARTLLDRTDATAPVAEPAGLFGEEMPPVTDAGVGAEAGAGAGAGTLHADADSPLFQQVAQGAHPNMMILRRAWNHERKRYNRDISVDDVRRLTGFLGQRANLTGRRRVVLVDAADDMNRNAANALLKPLEEPPADTVFLLVCHAPGRLLPTIRSRCRRLALTAPTLAAARDVLHRRMPSIDEPTTDLLLALSDNAPGRALRLHDAGGAELYGQLRSALSELPAMSRGTAQTLAAMTGTAGNKGEAEFALLMDLLSGFLGRLIRGGGEDVPALSDEREIRARLRGASLDPWFEVWDNLARLRERTGAVNLNRKAVTLSIFSSMEDAARKAAAGH